MAALEQARLQHFYLPAELRRTGELVASFEQQSAPVDPEEDRAEGENGRR